MKNTNINRGTIHTTKLFRYHAHACNQLSKPMSIMASWKTKTARRIILRVPAVNEKNHHVLGSFTRVISLETYSDIPGIKFQTLHKLVTPFPSDHRGFNSTATVVSKIFIITEKISYNMTAWYMRCQRYYNTPIGVRSGLKGALKFATGLIIVPHTHDVG